MIEPTLHYVSCSGAAAAASDAAGAVRTDHRVAYWEWNATGDANCPHVVVCVHGLTRQGRDFDVLAQVLARHVRVICPDMAGRGQSEWLADAQHYAVPQYAADMCRLLEHLYAQAPYRTLDWVGTSMGGLIGMALAGQTPCMTPVPVRRLVLNDVGPVVEWQALQRIGSYVGTPLQFNSIEQAAAALRLMSAGFGPHTDEEWLALCAPMLKPMVQGGFTLHYDPAIANALHAITPEVLAQAQEVMWQLYDGIQARTLVLRGAQSDLLSEATAQQMQQRGPKAQCITLANVGHAPTLVAADQVQVVQAFLLGEE